MILLEKLSTRTTGTSKQKIVVKYTILEEQAVKKFNLLKNKSEDKKIYFVKQAKEEINLYQVLGIKPDAPKAKIIELLKNINLDSVLGKKISRLGIKNRNKKILYSSDNLIDCKNYFMKASK